MFLITPCPMRTITARTTVHFELYKKKKPAVISTYTVNWV